MKLLVAFRKEWMELVRSYRLLVVGIVLLFFGLTSPLIAKFTPELLNIIPTGGITIQMPPPTIADAITQYIKNMSQFGILLALLLTMGAVSQEKDRGTAAMVLVKPLPRGVFLGAKFAAQAAMFIVALAAAGIACYYYTMLLFESMNILHWLAMNALLLLYVLVYVAITLLCSTLTRSQVAAGGMALGVLIVIGLIGTIPAIGQRLPGELITWGTRLMLGESATSWTAFGVSIGMIVVPLLAAWFIFRRQEL